MELRNNESLIDTFNFLRFPLIALVILIHCNLSEIKMQGVDIASTFPDWYYKFMYLFSEALTRLAVPIFFIISGYFFFYKIKDFSCNVYIGKLKRRIKSLLLPYIIWNLLAIAIVLLKSNMLSLFPSLAKENHDLLWFVGAFWNSQDGSCPILYPLWYVRDLIIVVILSPLIYMLIKTFRKWVLILFFILWYFQIVNLSPGFRMESFLFFSIGAYINIIGLNIRKEISKGVIFPPPCFVYNFCSSRYYI